MKNIIKLTCIAILLISSFSFGQQNENLVPKVIIEETKMSFWDLPHLKEAYIDISPTDRNDGLKVGKLDVNESNKDMIIKLAQEIAKNKIGDYDALLISH